MCHHSLLAELADPLLVHLPLSGDLAGVHHELAVLAASPLGATLGLLGLDLQEQFGGSIIFDVVITGLLLCDLLAGKVGSLGEALISGLTEGVVLDVNVC